jgi:hypothetical protein
VFSLLVCARLRSVLSSCLREAAQCNAERSGVERGGAELRRDLRFLRNNHHF